MFQKGTFFIQRNSVVRACWAWFGDEPLLLMSGERMKSSAPGCVLFFFSPFPLPPCRHAELKDVFQKTWRRES